MHAASEVQQIMMTTTVAGGAPVRAIAATRRGVPAGGAALAATPGVARPNAGHVLLLILVGLLAWPPVHMHAPFWERSFFEAG
ncbi:MAG: hypothetical protein JSW71_09830 [Gemmatimonadota bacterium]|nr:MAG: hypothetical protein JSW71_09830 [Gemmatimonadota bacterium]